MLSDNDITLSKTITFLKFPLIIAVVFIHAPLHLTMVNGTLFVNEGQFPIYDLLFHTLTYELACIAVPLFFFMSGFLFFYRSDFSLNIYKQKIRKRARTLLVPYIFWNVAVLILTLLSQLFLSSMLSGKTKLIADYDWIDWMSIFWANDGGDKPICYQFWFIRDLMVVTLFTPLLYYFIKYCKTFGILALGVLWLFNIWYEVPGFSIASFFFFSFGAWFSINRRNFALDFYSMRRPATILYIVLVVLDTCLWHYKITDYGYTSKIGIVVGLIAAVSWTAYGITMKRLPVSEFLVGSSFIIYAYHAMPLALATKYWMKLLSPVNEWTISLGYILIPCFIAGIGILIYALLHKYLPAFTALITGGR